MAYYLQVLTLVGLNGLLALSVYLVLSTGQLSLGNAGFMAIGGYGSALLAIKAGLPLWLSIPAGAVLASLVAIPLGYACLRLRGVYLAIATLGFSQTLVVVANNLKITGGALGIKNIPHLGQFAQKALRAIFAEPPFDLTFSQMGAMVVLAGVVLVLGLVLWFIYRQAGSRVGYAYTAIRTDEVAAAAMGIDTTYYKVLAFAQGAFIAGLAGALVAHTSYYIGPPDFGFNKAVEMLAYVVIGGMLVPVGPVLGVAALMFMSEGLRDLTLFGARMADYRLIIYGALMMLMMILRPQGLLTPALFKSKKRTAQKGAAA